MVTIMPVRRAASHAGAHAVERLAVRIATEGGAIELHPYLVAGVRARGRTQCCLWMSTSVCSRCHDAMLDPSSFVFFEPWDLGR